MHPAEKDHAENGMAYAFHTTVGNTASVNSPAINKQQEAAFIVVFQKEGMGSATTETAGRSGSLKFKPTR